MSSKEFELIKGLFDSLKGLLDNLNERLERIEERVDTRDPILTINDIAKDTGKTKGYLYGDGRWMLPNGGVSEFPGRPIRFRKSSFDAHRAKMGF